MVRLRSFDPVLLLSSVALVALGVALIYSASLASYGEVGALTHPVAKQLLFAIFGIILSLLIAGIDYRLLGYAAKPLYVAALAALVFVLVAGHVEYGARRWIALAGILWQPSEVAKIVTVIVLAKYLADRRQHMDKAATFLLSLAIAAVPALLVFVEPDLGTAVIFAAVWLGMVLMAGARPRHLLALFGLVLALLPFAIALVIDDYQRDRIALFLNPGREPLERGYNMLQAEISIGSGGLFGQGLTQGTQTQLSYLQTKTTDYIFSVLGEELGFMGAMALFGLYITLLFRGIRVANLARDAFGRLLATGIVVMVLTQVFINVGVNIRLFPVTGIPLPFISQGGTSLLSLFIGLGLLQSVVMRRRPWPFGPDEERYGP